MPYFCLRPQRRQIDIEMERRVAAEKARTSLERQIGLVRELLVDKKNNSIMTGMYNSTIMSEKNYQEIAFHSFLGFLSPDFDRERLAPVLTSTTSLKAIDEEPIHQTGQLGLHTGQGGAPPTRTTPKGR